MINLFTLAANDQSISYLGQVFGSMNGVLANGGNQLGGQVTLLGTMFKTFNSIVLSVGALIVVYVTIVGVMATAHEGEFLGKKWHNNIWIPIRIVIGIAALVPTGSGYSAIQIIMMWIIVQGIGAADTVWRTALTYINVVGSPYAQVTPPNSGVTIALHQLFQGLVCDASSREGATLTNVPGNGYYCATNSCSGAPAIDTNSTTLQLGAKPGSCGTLSYCDQSSTGLCQDANSLQCSTCKQQVAALQNIVPTLYTIAQQFVQADASYRDFYYNSGAYAKSPNGQDWGWINNYCNSTSIPKSQCCVGGTSQNPNIPPSAVCPNGSGAFPDANGNNGDTQGASPDAVKNLYLPYSIQTKTGSGDFISTSVNYYINSINTAITTYIQTQSQNTNNLNSEISNAESTGWIWAGGFYYMIATMNNNNLNSAMPPITMTADISKSPMLNYRNNFTAADVLISSAGGNPPGNLPGQLNVAVGQGSSDIQQNFQMNVTGSSTANPVTQLQAAGMAMLIGVEVMFLALIAVTVAIGIEGNIDVWYMGNGVMDPGGPTAVLVYFILIPAMFGLFGILISVGGLLAVYIPLIPYVVFTVAAIGWMIAVVEAMVAGPLVALGILSPGGQHEMLGRAEPALMMIFNIFLRPALMIFGLMAATLLATVVVKMINDVFWSIVFNGIFNPANSSNSSGSHVGAGFSAAADILEFCIFLAAYITLLVTALNKCFSLIYLLPNQVLQWIGVHHTPGGAGGEEGALGEVKSGVGRAGAGASSALSGAKHGVGEAMGKGKKGKTPGPGAQAGNAPGGGGAPPAGNAPGGGQQGGPP